MCWARPLAHPRPLTLGGSSRFTDPLARTQVGSVAEIWAPVVEPPASSAAAAEREYASGMIALRGSDESPRDLARARQVRVSTERDTQASAPIPTIQPSFLV